jgi:hypothetical protein
MANSFNRFAIERAWPELEMEAVVASQKVILLTGTNSGQRTLEQGLPSPWSTALERGHTLVSSIASGPDILICVDWNRMCRRLVVEAGRKSIKTVLIALEPSTVLPENSSPRVRKLFDRVLEVGRPNSLPSIPWPQTWHVVPDLGRLRHPKRVVMIQSAKLSFVRGQLYGLRASLASTVEFVDVYGHDWDEGLTRRVVRVFLEFIRALRSNAALDPDAFRTAFLQPRNNLGPVESKIETMKSYKVAIVIENSQEYMSEKFFDALFSGCIPVYVGPNLAPFGIPENLYVRADASLPSLAESINSAFEMDYLAWLAHCQSFLSNRGVREFWEEVSVNRRLLEEALGDHSH